MSSVDDGLKKLEEKIDILGIRLITLELALQLVLDQVDYINGNCRPNEMVGAVLSEDIIKKVRGALDE